MHSTKYIIELFSTLHYVASVENINQTGFQYSVLTSPPFLVKGHLSYIRITTCSIDILTLFFVSYSPDLRQPLVFGHHFLLPGGHNYDWKCYVWNKCH